jgi:glycosyltransferase involved in cell wall biosynthesis
MKILIATSGVPFIRGDAEILADNLLDALSEAGHQAELVVIPFKDYPPGRIPDQILACRLLDLTETCGVRIDRVIGLQFPAYLIPHPNKVIWLRHEPEAAGLMHCPDGPVIREAIRQADCELIPEARAVYALSQNVAGRVRWCSGIAAEPLYHPPANAPLFRQGSAGDYFFCPRPVNSANRQGLVIQAMALCRERVRIRFAGEPGCVAEPAECVNAIRKLKLSDRADWLGMVAEDQERELYANCLGVIFSPVDENYGYVTLEAMLSSKAVITCSDSGGPLEFVVAHQTGLVADPTPESLAQAMDMLWVDRRCAAAMGEAGRAHYQDLHISWAHVVEKLLC